MSVPSEMPVPPQSPALDAMPRAGRASWRASGLTWRALLLGLVFTALCDLWIHWAELVLGGRGHTALANISIPAGAFNILFLLEVVKLVLTPVPLKPSVRLQIR